MALAEKFPQPPSFSVVLPWPVMLFAYALYVTFWIVMIAVMAIVALALILWAVVYSIWLRARAAR